MTFEQLQAATSLLPVATDEKEISHVTSWLKEESAPFDILENEAEFRALMVAMLERVRNCGFIDADQYFEFAQFLTQEGFMALLHKWYFSNDESDVCLAVEAIFCIGYMLSIDLNQISTDKIYTLVGEHPARALELLHREDTATMMLQVLLSMGYWDPEKWQGEIELKSYLKDFLFSGTTPGENILAATQALELESVPSNLKYVYYFLDLLGFTDEQADAVVSAWREVDIDIDTTLECILPSLRCLIVLGAEIPDAPKTLHEVYGIKTFARYALEQYIYQYVLYKKTQEVSPGKETPSRQVVYAISTDYDANGVLLGKQEMWEKARRILDEQGLDLVVAEVGHSVEEIVDQLRKLHTLHGSAAQLIFTKHAFVDGLALNWNYMAEVDEINGGYNGAYKVISMAEFRDIILPELKLLVQSGGGMVFAICNAEHYVELFPPATIHPRGAVIDITDLNRGESVPLVPSFVVYQE